MRAPLLFAVPSFVLFVASSASAYDRLATPCATDPLTCETAPLLFHRIDAAPFEWSFDTGWVPQGSDLQVRIDAGLWADTHVDLAGDLNTTWPTGLTFTAPGAKNGGDFAFHYGAEFTAQGKLDISVFGQNYTWQGSLPYVPQFDLEVQSESVFDAWGFAPGVAMSSISKPQTIASIGLKDIIGTQIPGLDGGFALDVAVELDGTWTTTGIYLQTTQGATPYGNPIATDAGQATYAPASAPNIEMVAQAEGTLAYTGVVHVEPTFYVTLLGQMFQIPIVDIPIDVPITTEDWTFDPEVVHVPLPWLVTPEKLELGTVKVGEENAVELAFDDKGEADVEATLSTDDAQFTPSDATIDVAALTKASDAIRFKPKKAGDFQANLFVASNDPNTPMRLVALHGVGIAASMSTTSSSSGGEGGGGGAGGEGGGAAGDDLGAVDAKGSCACDVPGGEEPKAPVALVMAALALAAARRRRS